MCMIIYGIIDVHNIMNDEKGKKSETNKRTCSEQNTIVSLENFQIYGALM